MSLTAKQLPSYGGSSQTAADDIAHYQNLGYRVVVLAGDMRRARILCEFLDGHGIHAAAAEHPDALPEPGQCLVTAGSLSAGIEFPYARLAILTDTQIAASGLRRAKHKNKRTAKRSTPTRTFPSATSSCMNTTASAALRALCRCRSTVR